jgi:hypothetical protein
MPAGPLDLSVQGYATLAELSKASVTGWNLWVSQ